MYVEWNQFCFSTSRLIERIKEKKYNIHQIIAVSRDGLIPAGMIAHALDIRDVDIINSVGYEGENKKKSCRITRCPCPPDRDGRGILVVDAFCDTGMTANAIKKVLPLCTLVSTLSRPEGLTILEEVGDIIRTPGWVLLPWDRMLDRYPGRDVDGRIHPLEQL